MKQLFIFFMSLLQVQAAPNEFRKLKASVNKIHQGYPKIFFTPKAIELQGKKGKAFFDLCKLISKNDSKMKNYLEKNLEI